MKKRVIAILLLCTMLVTVLPVPAAAVETRYGKIPIYIGYADVDDMAEEILSQIPLAGKDEIGQIQAVYDWVIQNCSRIDNYGTYYLTPYFNSETAGVHYAEMAEKIARGEAVVRKDLETYYGVQNQYGFNISFDSNFYLGNYAYDMMLKREGNCVHFTALLVVLLGHLGYDSRLIAGSVINGNGSASDHKWNYTLVDGRYYWMDSRMDQIQFRNIGYIDHSYFMKLDTAGWANRHQWNHTYSDVLAEHAQEIQALYEASAMAKANPWELCDDWAQDAMKAAYDAGLVPVALQRTDLRQDITRAEFSAVAVSLYEALTGTAVPVFTGASPFADTNDDAVLKAYQLGAVSGMGNRSFLPEETLTREQAAAILGRVYERYKTGKITGGATFNPTAAEGFEDRYRIAEWAKGYVGLFVENGVISGVGNNRFAPKQAISRQAALKIVTEAVSRMK